MDLSLRERGNCISEDGKPESCNNMGQGRVHEAIDLEIFSDEGERKDGQGRFFGPSVGYGEIPMESLKELNHGNSVSSDSIDGCALPTRGCIGDEVGVTLAQVDHAAELGTDESHAKAERMEFEGEGEAATFC